jgi:hypothetical protein
VALPQFPPDPEPTEAELEPFLEAVGPCRDETVRHGLAILRWRIQKSQEDPDLFAVPFAGEIRDFAGFADYESYLQSPLWRRIRKEVLLASKGKCVGCDNRASEVHHRDYRPRVLAGKDLAALVPVCKSCHDKIEGARKGEHWGAGERVLYDLVAEKERARLISD